MLALDPPELEPLAGPVAQAHLQSLDSVGVRVQPEPDEAEAMCRLALNLAHHRYEGIAGLILWHLEQFWQRQNLHRPAGAQRGEQVVGQLIDHPDEAAAATVTEIEVRVA